MAETNVTPVPSVASNTASPPRKPVQSVATTAQSAPEPQPKAAGAPLSAVDRTEEDGDITLPADYEQLVAEQSSSPRENTCSLILGEAALHGLAGRIVRKLEPETEAHPAAMLIEILTNFGSIIGRTAYFEVEDMTHCGNLFAVRVGDTSKGRKGTAGARINRVFRDADPTWFLERRVSGLSSGERALADEQIARRSARYKRHHEPDGLTTSISEARRPNEGHSAHHSDSLK